MRGCVNTIAADKHSDREDERASKVDELLESTEEWFSEVEELLVKCRRVASDVQLEFEMEDEIKERFCCAKV